MSKGSINVTTASGGNSGGAGDNRPTPPFVNRHSLSEILGSVGNSKELKKGN